MDKPKPVDFGYNKKYGWPNKTSLQSYRKAMSEYQKFKFNHYYLTRKQ